MLNAPQRHDFVYLDAVGRAQAWQNRQPGPEWDDRCWLESSNIPAIYTGRTMPGCSESLQLGFSFPARRNGVRCRFATYVPLQTILRIVTPWETIHMEGELTGGIREGLDRLQATAQTLGIQLGLFGSTALQKVTGLPYLHPNSDLDILLDLAPISALETFAQELERLEGCIGLSTDAELRIQNGQYVKFKELFLDQKTILVKGGAQPELLSRREVWTTIQAADRSKFIQNEKENHYGNQN